MHLLSFEDTVLYYPRGGDQKRGFDVRNCPTWGNLRHLEGGPSLMPCYSPGMGVRGFPLIFHSLILLAAGSVNVVTGQKVSAKPDLRKKIRLVRFA